jgi:hypothetical protein
MLMNSFAVILPDEAPEPRAGKAPASPAKFPQGSLAVEDGVDSFQRPALVQHDPFAEQSGPIEHRAVGVQVSQQVRG